MGAMGRVPRYHEVSQGLPKIIFKTHVTIAIFLSYTLTFIITVLKVKTLGYRWMEGGGFVRDQAGKGGRHRFCMSNFRICISNFKIRILELLISLIEILLINKEVGNRKGFKNRGHFLHTVLEPIYLILQEIPGS